ncbi:MAG: PAS domain S-box protein [Myxococcota bacterium]|nr:PAS domain S-box protein [Myxococcota bacterium]
MVAVIVAPGDFAVSSNGAPGSLEVNRLAIELQGVERALRDEDGLVAFDPELHYLHWSRRIEEITGVPASRVLGRSAVDLFPSMVENGQVAALRAALAGSSVTSTVQPFHMARTGHRGVYQARYQPWFDERGTVVAALVVVRDLTDEQRFRRRIEETESRFRNMADHSPVMLWMSGADALRTFFNTTWLAFTGRTLQEELGLGFAEGIHPEDHAGYMESHAAAFSERRVLETEYRLKRADGQWRWVLDRATPRWLPSAEFAGFIGSCIDITARRERESELRQGLRDRDDFLSIASHELMTPLTSLQLSLDAVLRALRSGPDATTHSSKLITVAQRASAQSLRLASLVDELLDVSRLSSQRLQLELDEADLGTIVHDAALRVADAAAAAACLIVETPSPEPVTGHWDSARLQRVTVNLISNAIKYGAGKPVDLGVRGTPTEAIMTVSDQGIGIAEAHHGRIFERFERAVSTRNYGGFGLGLWIAREIVGAHGGRIDVASAPGKGATFKVTLPRSPV